MKVLLLQDVKGVGRKYDIKEVSDGYARNFLIARKLAAPADGAAMKLKAATEAQEQARLSSYRESAKRLADEVLEFRVRAGEKGEVFGSIKAGEIKKALLERGYEAGEVLLDQPLRVLGEHEVSVKFGRGVTGKVRVRITAGRER